MKSGIEKRREYMIMEYSRSFSVKQAIEATANMFQVSPDALYMDWERRHSWLKELVKLNDNGDLIRRLILEIQLTLKGVDELRVNADNDNCRLGALKLRISTLFRLIDLLHSYDAEELRERVVKLEALAEKGVFVP